jgi:hypothetical protein
MRTPFLVSLVALTVAGAAAFAQAPGVVPPTPPPREVAPPPSPAEELKQCAAEMEKLHNEEAALRAAAQNDEQKKQIELLQKQIETLEKLVKLLADQVKRQGPALEKVEAQAATLEARSAQAAQRDVQLAGAVDDLREHQDFVDRYGPMLPAPLKELFLPSGTNETPLSVYGTLAVGYSKIYGDTASAANGAGRAATPGAFYFGEFTPDFFLKLNDWIFLQAEISVGPSTALGAFAEADFFLTDWLTISAGRMVAPIGWYNLRSNNPWVTKLPTDAPGSGPVLWQQVLPTISLLGVQAQGAFYLGCSPFKMEYNFYVSNGLNLTPATAGAPTLTELANLENMESTFNPTITNDKMVGGRLGLWWPEEGLEVGASALANGDYVAGGFHDTLSLWALDFNYHMGDWDVRAEYGSVYQQAGDFSFPAIRREGFSGQVAYRPYEVPCKYVQNTELVYRYSYVTFPGIDVNELDLTQFNTPTDVPARRQQNEFGVNYYFYPRMVLKLAYQINDEPKFHLHDNQFIAELAWGW